MEKHKTSCPPGAYILLGENRKNKHVSYIEMPEGKGGQGTYLQFKKSGHVSPEMTVQQNREGEEALWILGERAWQGE